MNPTTKKKTSIVHLGCAGHFICSKDCHWRRHSQVGTYRVSTVGNLYYAHDPHVKQTLGAAEDSFFETMVFETASEPAFESEGCGCLEVKSWSELDFERYATAKEAQEGHERFIAKYLELSERENS